MAYRDQWKMLHSLNTSKRGALNETELIEMGIDCYPDTIWKEHNHVDITLKYCRK